MKHTPNMLYLLASGIQRLWGIDRGAAGSVPRAGKEVRKSMRMPLVLTGPGGDFRAATHVEDGHLIRRPVYADFDLQTYQEAPHGASSSLAGQPTPDDGQLASLLSLMHAHRPNPHRLVDLRLKIID